MPSNKANSLRGFRLAAAALCVALSGCTMALQNEARLGRLTTSDLKPTKATLVFGLDASRGPIGVALRRFDPPPLVADADGKCSEASASTPEGSTGKTYFVFDVPPGRYAMQNHEALVFVVPAGKQVYIGDFVGARRASPDYGDAHLEPQHDLHQRPRNCQSRSRPQSRSP